MIPKLEIIKQIVHISGNDLNDFKIENKTKLSIPIIKKYGKQLKGQIWDYNITKLSTHIMNVIIKDNEVQLICEPEFFSREIDYNNRVNCLKDYEGWIVLNEKD
jgi:hypothetical protein